MITAWRRWAFIVPTSLPFPAGLLWRGIPKVSVPRSASPYRLISIVGQV
jgi:hypothetical protein